MITKRILVAAALGATLLGGAATAPTAMPTAPVTARVVLASSVTPLRADGDNRDWNGRDGGWKGHESDGREWKGHNREWKDREGEHRNWKHHEGDDRDWKCGHSEWWKHREWDHGDWKHESHNWWHLKRCW